MLSERAKNETFGQKSNKVKKNISEGNPNKLYTIL